MNTDALKQQQLTLLARKALLTTELDQVDRAISQIGAILQFAEQNAPAPEAPAAE